MEQWKQELKEKGYTHLRGVVPPDMIAAARAEIDGLYQAAPRSETGGAELDSKGCKSVQNLLRKPPMSDYVEAALGWDNLAWYQEHAQIAYIPARRSSTPWQHGPHIDGFFDKGTDPVPFSLLVGVYVSSTPKPFAGNFVVWPGSHLTHEKYFREHGRDAWHAGQPYLYYAHSVQLLLEPGDAVLCHYLLAHAAAENTSDVDRIAAYFRIAARGDRWEQLTNLWSGWKF
jgi:hypothetical protein